jgi:hypothetical protein
MPLSIIKLEELLSEKGYIIDKYFVMDKYCFYIQVFSIDTSELFLMYIPSKYNFEVEGDNVYKIKYINMSSPTYGGNPNAMDIQDIYGIQNYDIIDEKVEEHLESNYKHGIDISEITGDDTEILKSIYRQLKRLKYSVQNLKYKLGIVYKNYICAIRRDDSIDCFFIKNYPRTEGKKLFVITDLETIYEKIDSVKEEIIIVKNNIFHVLERNYSLHGKVIDKIIQNKKDMANLPQKALEKNQKYTNMILKLEKNLSTILSSEQKYIERLRDLEEGGNEVHKDVERFAEISSIREELKKIGMIKGDITKNILILREKKENTVLNIDKIMFDNTVMLDSIFKNFSKLKDYS